MGKIIADKNIEFITEFTFEDPDVFLNSIVYGGKLYEHFINTGAYIFRGQESAHYKLIPSVLRDNMPEIRHTHFRETKYATTDREQLAFEFDILREFYFKCDECGLYLPDNKRFRSGQFSFDDCGTITTDGEWLPEDLYDIAALAQHYGLPTRLLDWTYDINVAIYFAIQGLIKKQTFDGDDYISIWCMNASMNAWGSIEVALPDFPLRLIRPIYKYNPNMRAQKGLFSLWKIQYKANSHLEKDCRPLDELIDSFFETKEERFKNMFLYMPFLTCFKIRQNKENISGLYKFIKTNNTNSSTLFPGYAGVVDFLKYDRLHEYL